MRASFRVRVWRALVWAVGWSCIALFTALVLLGIGVAIINSVPR